MPGSLRLAVAACFIIAVGVVFYGLASLLASNGTQPAPGIGLIVLAVAIALVWGAVAIIRRRRRIAAKAADLSIGAMAGGVKLTRTVQRKAGELRDRVNERANRDPR